MTSDSDNPAGRRPPTIELAATEVDDGAEKPAAGEADTAPAQDAEAARAASDAAAPAPSRRLRSHIASAVLGAAIMAAIGAGLWLSGLLPMPLNTPAEQQAANIQAPAPLPTMPPSNSSVVQPSSPPGAQSASLPPDIAARLDRIERAIETQRPDPALVSRIAAAEAQAKSVGDALAALRGRLDETAATGQSAAREAEMALNAAQAAKSASEAANRTDVQRSDLDALAQRIMALESAVKGLAAATAPLAAGVDDRAARLAIAAEALRNAAERGAAYEKELATLRALGVDQNATAPLESFAASGVPSAATLSRELEALTPALQQAAVPAAEDASFLGRLTANAQNLVRISPASAPPGNDPAAVVARIRFAAARGDIAAAMTDINALPDSAKSLADAWSKKAAAREAALAASRQIVSDALAALGKPPAR
jgi:hypothetical protein